jgi:hypothetical protein
LGRSSLAGISGKTPPVKVIFNVNVVLDVYATERTRLRKAMREAGLQEVRFRFDFEGTKILTMD